MPNIESTIQAVVTSKVEGARDVVVLQFSSENGADLPPWAPGAHIDVHLPNGLVRQYSLCGDPTDRKNYTIGVLNAPASRGGSRYVHDSLHLGTAIKLVGPRNNFELVDAEKYILIAGGIGITPIAAMAKSLEEQGKEWHLTYGGRSIESMAMLKDFEESQAKVTLWPQDTHGIINLAEVLANPADGTVVYACGPEPLLQAVEAICDQKWPAGTLHLERFAAKLVEAKSDFAFEIELAKSGKVFTVPTDKTVLETLEENGVHVISSCQEGTCGTCDTGVLSGTVDHRDSVLTKQEQANNDCMMVCVSRASCPKLVIDL